MSEPKEIAVSGALPDPWSPLSAVTPARIALGRAGGSLPTAPLLDFQLAHARARDAVHTEFHPEEVCRRLQEGGFETLRVRSRAAGDRKTYLQRPDLGRRLDDESREELERFPGRGSFDLLLVVGDGLSAPAAERHTPPVMAMVREELERGGWKIAPVVVAEGARVALADEIGQILGAAQVAILLGERPGLSSPHSLGIYLTFAPKIGRSDAERNCISNVRPEGLGYREAARKLVHLVRAARNAGGTGVALKDDSDILSLETAPGDGEAGAAGQGGAREGV
ncbi:MAG TPA: ethanolamine ammonia-lyase subunit EutC [Verrucomicrobiae bacterium]|nr:ethanolamine ammonia-lyase subunit EutC [Verrucomicrobiae bacterium]